MDDTSGLPRANTLPVVIFWAAIAAFVTAIVVFRYVNDGAEILLTASSKPELVSGVVTFEGAPVRGGVLHLIVSDVENRRYRNGATLVVGEDGKFTSQGGPTLGIGDDGRALHILAVFRGTTDVRGKQDSKPKPLSGESTIYLNSAPPLGERFLWGLGIAGAVLLVVQLILFTGSLGQRKARWLFVLMYFFTFVSLALPISVSLIVAQNQYLVDSMEKSPLGLVKAKTRVLSSPQWLIMIGGTVVPDVKSPATPSMPEGGDRTTEATRTKTDVPTGLEAGDGRAVPKSETSPASWTPKIVEGGVAIPFYVLLLAMFGAGINMTLKVPEIQRSYEDVLLEAPALPLMNPLTAISATWRLLRGQPEAPGVVPVVVPRKTAGDIRQELIENYMYLLSAPLLAIAMYYLLQVMADQLTQPVLVIMAFATGLVSKAVIGGIINFAEDKLLGEKRRQRQVSTQVSPEVAAKAEEAKTRQAEAKAAVRASEQAMARKDAAEAAARAAEEDAAKKMQQTLTAVEAAAGNGAGTQREADTAKEEAEKAAREVVAKQAEAKDAAEMAARAAKEAEAKQAGARVAANEAQRAKAEEAAAHAEAAANVAIEAAGKQSEARAATEATEEAAKLATEKQVVAEEAVRAVVQPMHAVAQEAKSIEREAQSAASATGAGAPPRSGAAADTTTKD